MASVLDLTEEQVLNLARLADWLRALPEDYAQFEMEHFMLDRQLGQIKTRAFEITDCGTVACAVGHGPMAGIQPQPAETWVDYSERCFAPSGFLFSYLFASDWSYIDNTPHGAAARIAHLLAEPEAALDGSRSFEDWSPDVYEEYLS